MFENYPDVLNIDEVCALLRISRKTAYKLIRNGDLPARRIGRIHRISKQGLIEYVNLIGKSA